MGGTFRADQEAETFSIEMMPEFCTLFSFPWDKFGRPSSGVGEEGRGRNPISPPSQCSSRVRFLSSSPLLRPPDDLMSSSRAHTQNHISNMAVVTHPFSNRRRATDPSSELSLVLHVRRGDAVIDVCVCDTDNPKFSSSCALCALPLLLPPSAATDLAHDDPKVTNSESGGGAAYLSTFSNNCCRSPSSIVVATCT